MPKAKTNTFFIRTELDVPATSVFTTEEVEIGAFVDALGEALLRIHSIQVAYTGTGGGILTMDTPGGPPNIDGTAALRWQLCTQEQDAMVRISDKSLIASGVLEASNLSNDSTNDIPTNVYDSMDVGPQDYIHGYLIAVESLFLQGQATSEWGETCGVSIILECSVEKATKESAMALALSQS